MKRGQLPSRVDDQPALEPRAQHIPHDEEVGEIAFGNRGGEFDLDAHRSAVGSFDDEIHFLSPREVEMADVCPDVRPGLLEKFGRDEILKQVTGGYGIACQNDRLPICRS